MALEGVLAAPRFLEKPWEAGYPLDPQPRPRANLRGNVQLAAPAPDCQAKEAALCKEELQVEELDAP